MPRLVRRQEVLTSKEATFIRHYLEGSTGTSAARLAGYKNPSEAHRLLSRPEILQEVRRREEAALNGDLLSLSNDVIRRALDVDGCPGVPWPSRLKAAEMVHNRVFKDVTGHEEKQLSDMSPGELADMLEKLHAKAADMAKDVEAVVIEQNAQPGEDLFG